LPTKEDVLQLGDTPEEAAFRAEAREWLSAHAPAFEAQGRAVAAPGQAADTPEAYGKIERASHDAARAWQAELHGGGWAGISWPKQFGGRGGSPIQTAIFAEEQGRFAVSNGPLMVSINMVGPTLMAHGTEQQQADHLEKIISGQEIWCQLYSEPGAGSDLASLRTRAVLDGDEWVVNGQKVWNSSARAADWAILLARTDPDVPKHRGITYFIVDMRSPGIDVRPLRQASGAYHFNEVFLDEVRIPRENVLGDTGDGWNVARTTLANERAMIGGGGSRGQIPALIELARKNGRGDDPVIRQGIADVVTREAILRYLGLRARTALSKGVPPGPEASVMKLLVGQYMTATADLGLQIEGAAGMLAGKDAPSNGDWQLARNSVWTVKIGGGTDEIQRNVLAERILGLPREQQVDRDTPFRDLLGRG
jgi:alkylation response protein AidB-like acyl-CoA dehydrogenase